MNSLQQRVQRPPMISVSDASVVDNDASPSTPTATREIDGNDLRFAPVHRLVEMCVLSFEVDGELRESQAHFPMALFLVHQWWMPFAELGAHFVALYKSAPKRCEHCVNGEKEHQGDIERCESLRFRTLLCHAVARWIRAFPMHFDANSQLCKLVERLQHAAVQDGLAHLADLLDVSAVPSYAWLRNVSVRNPIIRQVSLSFEQWSPEEIATSLTHIEHKMLRRITFSEYKQYACSTNLTTTPILERSISVFNSLCNWVQCMVLNKPSPKERADIITKFVNVGKTLKKLHNFNTLMSVIGGITHSSIARLTKTNSCLLPEIKKELSSLTELLSNQCNYANYRKALEEAHGFLIPIVGVHLKDLIVLQSALPDYDDSGQVNCKKLSQLATVFAHLMVDLDRPHNLPDPNMDLINTLKVSLDIHYKEDDIYELSLKREPRTLLNFQSTNRKSVVFAEWAAGVCSAPDPETVNKHVAAMVDAVFKHYDHDRDGYISKAEFELIAGNFPFIDPFVMIDADRDGQISRTEMITYFIKVNQQSVAFRRGFKHNFHETTFLTPTMCIHCNKLLWGLIRQGFKCKDCGLPAHRTCKDFAVAECRRKQPQNASIFTTGRTNSLPETDGVPSTIPEDGSEPPSSGTATQRRKLFLNISGCRSSTVAFSSPALPTSALQSAREMAAPHSPTDSEPFTPPAIATPLRKKRFAFAFSRSRPNRLRTVSTTSDSPSPEPVGMTPPVMQAEPGRALVRLRLPSRHKPRTRSETNDCYRCQSPEYANEVDILPSLASEEVFEEESTSNASSRDESSNQGAVAAAS